MVNTPAEWSAKLQHAVLPTMQATFSPQLALKVALLLKRGKRLGVVEMNLSTSYENEDSKGFFRKLGLRPYAVFWAMDIAPAPPQETKLVSRQEVGGFGGKAED